MKLWNLAHFVIAALFIGMAIKMSGFLRWGLYAVGCLWLILGLWRTRLDAAKKKQAEEEKRREERLAALSGRNEDENRYEG